MQSIFYRIKLGLVRHWVILVLATSMSVLVSAQVIFFPLVAGPAYQNINIAPFGPDELTYLSRAKEVLEDYGLGNIILREGKDKQDPLFSLGERTLLLPFTLLNLGDHVDVVTLYNIFNFFGVIVLIVLIYWLVWQLSHNRLVAAAAALFVIGGYSIVYTKNLFYTDLNIYGRAMMPYVSSIFFFLFLNAVFSNLRRPSLARSVSVGLIFGYLFYFYFFTWTFAVAFYSLLCLVYILRRDWASVKYLSVAGGIGLLVGGKNLWDLYWHTHSAFGPQFVYFMASVTGRTAIFSKIGAITLCIFAVYWWKRQDDDAGPFIGALIGAGWVALNQQVLTGRLLQFGHYYWYFIVPVSIAASLYMLWRLLPISRYYKLILTLIIVLAFVNTIGGQYQSFLRAFDYRISQQNYRPIIDKLQQLPQGIILTKDGGEPEIFTVYTKHDLFWGSYALYNEIPLTRVRDALYVYSYLNKDARDNFTAYYKSAMENPKDDSMYKDIFGALEGYQSGFDFYTYNHRARYDYALINSTRTPLLEELGAEYKKITQNPNGIKQLFNQYDVSYLVWDRQTNPEWDLDFLTNKKLLYQSGPLFLYELN